jgi:hypothetical protein
VTQKYTPKELAEQLTETSTRLTGAQSNDPNVLAAWKDYQHELEQQLHDLQHGRKQGPP